MPAGAEQRAGQIVSGWLDRFNQALEARDAAELGALFRPDGHWRDIVGLTWRTATVSGREGVADALLPAAGGTARDLPYTVRFHLHPAVRVLGTAETTVRLGLPSGETWLFETEGGALEVEDSVYLAAQQGPKRTAQIVIQGRVAVLPRLPWSFTRVA